jgi:site-specific recombinase XerD
MEEALAEFLRHLAVEKNASTHTVKSYREDLTGPWASSANASPAGRRSPPS